MNVDMHIKQSFSVNRRLNASAKSFGPGQPAQSAQADLSRNFLHLVNFLTYLMTQSVAKNMILWIHKRMHSEHLGQSSDRASDVC